MLMVNTGLVGAGRWGSNLMRNVAADPNARLAAVCDVDPAAFKEQEMLYRGVPFYTDLEQMLGEVRPDAVMIASPPPQHYSQAFKVIETGTHVFIEKPLAMSSLEAKEIVRAAEKAGVILMVGHTFLYNNLVHEVKRRIEKGELGDIYYLYFQRLNLGRVRKDVDVTWNLGPHDISISNYLLNARPHSVSARALTFLNPEGGKSDVGFFQMNYSGNRATHVHLSWIDPQKVRRTVIVGSKKMLIYDDMDPERHIQIFDKRVERKFLDRVNGFAEFKMLIRAGDLSIPNIHLVEPLAVEVGHFVECIREGKVPNTDGRHGLEIVDILEALRKSSETGGGTVGVEYTKL